MARVLNVEAREVALSNHVMAVEMLEAMAHPEEAGANKMPPSLGDDDFSKHMNIHGLSNG
jgi:hypothetical protein